MIKESKLLRFIIYCVISFIFILASESWAQEELKDIQRPKGSRYSRKDDALFLSIDKAIWQDTDEGKFVFIQGVADLPEGGSVFTFLKRKNRYISGKDALVKNSIFETELGPFKEEFYLGLYTIEVAFIPRRQSLNILAVMPEERTRETTSVYFDLLFGEIDKINESQNKICEDISDLVTQLEKLYNELDSMYKKHNDEFSISEWQNWSKEWYARLDKLDKINEKRNEGKIVALFPSIEEDIEGNIGRLRMLGSLYLRKLQGQKEGMITAKGASSMIAESLFFIKDGLRVDFIPEYEFTP